jgi:hypothetical protein
MLDQATLSNEEKKTNNIATLELARLSIEVR